MSNQESPGFSRGECQEIDRIDEWEEDGENGTDIDVTVTVHKTYDICALNESIAAEKALEIFRDEFGDYDDTTITVICC